MISDKAQHRPNPWLFAVACLLALSTLFAAYSNYFQNSFHFDDSHVIESNVYIRSLRNAPRFFTDARTVSSLPSNSNYRPLVTLSLAVDYWLAGGLKYGPFHATQFSLLVFLGLLVFFLFRHLLDLCAPQWWNRYLALFAALIYCIHTANTETLNIISSRSELISTIGIVASFLLYIHSPKTRKFGLYLVPMALGALAKPPAVMFAPLLFVYAFLFEQEAKIDRWFQALKAALPAFVVGFALFIFVNKMDHPEAVYSNYNRWDYALTQPFIWLHYFRLFFLPVGLTADTDWKLLEHWYDTRLFAGILFIAILAFLTWRTSQRPSLRPVSFGLAWFALALMPASSIVPLSEVANEHRVFFPYIGLSLAAVWWSAESLKGLAARHPRQTDRLATASGLLALLTIFGFAVGTYRRNQVWKTEETLWYDVTLKSPTNGRALMNYGLTQMSKGRYSVAKDYFERALVFNPAYATLEINLGIVNAAMNDQKAAEEHFQRALKLQPRFAEGHFFYARWLQQQNRIDEAVAHLETTLAISPALSPARDLLMNLYAQRGQQDKLGPLVQQTLAIWPDDPTAKLYAKSLGPKP